MQICAQWGASLHFTLQRNPYTQQPPPPIPRNTRWQRTEPHEYKLDKQLQEVMALRYLEGYYEKHSIQSSR